MRIKELFEEKEVSLVGMIVNGKRDFENTRFTSEFVCSSRHLTSLKGSPSKVLGYFDCSKNKLTSLEGGPKEVNGNYNCEDNELISLKGSPKRIVFDFNCSYNAISSFEGSPEEIDGDADFEYNELSSFEGAPKIFRGNFSLIYNNFTSLKDIHLHIKEINGTLSLDGNLIKSHVLGLLKIKGLKRVRFLYLTNESKDLDMVNEIVNKYLPLGNIYDCQDELIQAGLEEYAQL